MLMHAHWHFTLVAYRIDRKRVLGPLPVSIAGNSSKGGSLSPP